MEKHWDQIADVVVVGNGGAGGVAAISAHDLGAEVLVIERQEESTHCSSTKMSGGTLLLPRDESVADKAFTGVIPGAFWIKLG